MENSCLPELKQPLEFLLLVKLTLKLKKFYTATLSLQVGNKCMFGRQSDEDHLL